jgi:hypothetical protein
MPGIEAATLPPADRSHSYKWRVCPVCQVKLQHHRDSEEFWEGPRKQLAHRKKCATRLRLYVRLGGTLDGAERYFREGR